MKPLNQPASSAITADYFADVTLSGERLPTQNGGTAGRYACEVNTVEEFARSQKPGNCFRVTLTVLEILTEGSLRKGDRWNLLFTENQRAYYKKDIARFISACCDGESDMAVLAETLGTLLEGDFDPIVLDITIEPKDDKPEWGNVRYGNVVTEQYV